MLAKKLINQSAVYGIASILVNGSSFLLIPLYTRSLSPNEYGILSSVGILSSLYTYFLGFGLSGSISRYYFDLKVENSWRSFFSTASIFVTISGLFITSLLFFLCGNFLDLIFKSVRFDPFIKYGIWIGYLGVLAFIPLALYQVQSRAILYRILTTSSFLILTIFMVYYVVLNRQGSIGALKAQLYSGLIMGLVYISIMIYEGGINFNTAFLKTSLTFGVPLMIYSISGVFIEMSSKYFIEKLGTLSELGIYNLAQQYSSALVIIISAINMAWVPIFYEQAKEKTSKVPFIDFGTYFLATIVTIGLFLCLFSKEILLLLASESYQKSFTVVPIILLAYIFGNGFWILIINPISFVKKTIFLPILTFTSALFSIVFNSLLIPILGIYGAALSLLASYMVMTVIGLFIVRKYYPIDYKYFKFLFIILLAGFVFLISNFLYFEKIYEIIIGKFVLFVIFLISLFMFKIIQLSRIKPLLTRVVDYRKLKK